MSMFSELARVFSSQGVVLPGAERIPVYKKSPAESPCDHKNNCSCFAPKFDQAAAKLELSKQGRDSAGAAKAANAANAADTSGSVNMSSAAVAADPAITGEASGADAQASGGAATSTKDAEGKPLDEDARKQVEELRKRDREVKAHEAAHKAAAGGNAKGAAGYEYQKGPDGRQYAVGGHVDIEMSPVQGNPQATLAKARTVQRAAMAPADPSGQDRSVAAAAAQMASQAQQEISETRGNGGEYGEGEGQGNWKREVVGEKGTVASLESAHIRSYGKPKPPAGASINVFG